MIEYRWLPFVFCLALLAQKAEAGGAYRLFGGFIPEGKPVIDGRISPGEWSSLGRRESHKFFGEDSRLVYYLMWDRDFLYLAADVRDHELWVDDFDPQRPWVSTFDDDAVKWEFDPDLSRDEFLQPGDRVLAINADGSAMRFDQGDGNGSTAAFPLIDAIEKAARYDGTLNDETFKTVTRARRDRGYVIEAAISWKNLYGSATVRPPVDGDSIGINITTIEDDTGGPLDPSYYQEWKRVFDEITPLAGEEGHPENWARFVFAAAGDRRQPDPIADLALDSVGGRSVWLTFTAPGDNGATGVAHHYEIRLSRSPIDESNFSSATPYLLNVLPRQAGERELLQIIGLEPGSRHYIAIRAVDEAGNAASPAVVAVQTSGAAGDDPGFVTLCPGRRYFCLENGRPLVVVGDNQGIPWPRIRTFYNGPMWDQVLGKWRNFRQEEGLEEGRAYLRMLADHGVNTLRLILEAYDIDHPVRLVRDVGSGPGSMTFDQDTLDFVSTVVEEAAKVGIYLILTPLDTFHYRDRWSEVPFSRVMSSPDELFLAENRGYLKKVLDALCERICGKKNVLAVELLNEFDSDDPQYGWNRAAFASREATVNELADYYRGIDPDHLVFVSSVRWDPKFTGHIPQADLGSLPGADKGVVLNNGHMDFNSTHMYYHDIRDPNLNQPGNVEGPGFTYQVADQDNTVAPAVRVDQGLRYYQANAFTPKPYLDTESGPILFFTSRYDAFFSQADDEQYFHNMIWAHLAAGGAGTGLRWPGEMLDDHALTAGMRAHQKALSRFVAAMPGFATFAPRNISAELRVTGTHVPVVAIGSSDGERGIVFLLKDQREGLYPSVTGASLEVGGLSPRHRYLFEFWDSYDAERTVPVSTAEVIPDAAGMATVPLPAFATSWAIQFRQTGEVAGAGYAITDDLWLRVLIHSEEKGPIDAVWVKGGEARTGRGDRVIWGYFHADPKDVSWGSPQNPEAFVKIWFDAGGRTDVNLFHVSVPDIEVRTDFGNDGMIDESDMITTGHRYVRHYREQGRSGRELQATDTAVTAGGRLPNPRRYGILNDLDIGAAIDTVEAGSIDAVWRLGGQDRTGRGDEVVWGYFHASPDQVGWGDENNPEVFVKVWFDASGRTDVNFFHVSVPDIETSSAFPGGGKGFGRQSLLKTSQRYVRHVYDR